MEMTIKGLPELPVSSAQQQRIKDLAVAVMTGVSTRISDEPSWPPPKVTAGCYERLSAPVPPRREKG